MDAHITRTHSKRVWHGTTADKDTRNEMRKKAQENLEHVVCEGEEIENVWVFKYLGSIFRADGSQIPDILARIAMATTTAGKMRQIWASKSIPFALKLRIYKTGVCSRLVYGSEGWLLNAKACAMLNGANSRLITRITNKSVREEVSRRTRTFDIVQWIRARRLQWVGHILRMDDQRLVKQALRYIYDNEKEGDLLMDAPRSFTWKGLQQLAFANERKTWRSMVYKLKNPGEVEIIMNDALPGATARRPASPPTPQPKKKSKPTSKYVTRDRHAAFFLPGKHRYNTRSKKRKGARKGLTRPKKLTNKEKRLYWAAKEAATSNHEHAAPLSAPPVPTETDSALATKQTETVNKISQAMFVEPTEEAIRTHAKVCADARKAFRAMIEPNCQFRKKTAAPSMPTAAAPSMPTATECTCLKCKFKKRTAETKVPIKPLQKMIRCNDGFRISVQASTHHECTPRDNVGPYLAVEVGYPSKNEPRLEPYREVDVDDPIYTQVPAQIIREIISAHAGLHHSSGKLPPLEKQDAKGHLYAAALPKELLPDTPPPKHSTKDPQHLQLTFDSPEIMGHRVPTSSSPHKAPADVSDML